MTQTHYSSASATREATHACGELWPKEARGARTGGRRQAAGWGGGSAWDDECPSVDRMTEKIRGTEKRTAATEQRAAPASAPSETENTNIKPGPAGTPQTDLRERFVRAVDAEPRDLEVAAEVLCAQRQPVAAPSELHHHRTLRLAQWRTEEVKKTTTTNEKQRLCHHSTFFFSRAIQPVVTIASPVHPCSRHHR